MAAPASAPSPRLAHLTAPTLRALPEPALRLPFRESFTLKSAGAAPREPARYALRAEERRYTVTAELRGRSLQGGAAAAPVQAPRFHETFAIRALPPATTGGRLRWRGEPIRVDGDAGAARPYVARWQELLAGRRAQLDLPRDAPWTIVFAEDPLQRDSQPEIEELTQRLLGYVVPLPDEAIGRGARWTVVTVLRQGGAAVKQTAKYELLERAGGRLTLAVDLRRVAEEQRVARPGLPEGSALDLVAMFRAVTGRVEVDLGAPLPVRGELEIEVRTHQRLRQASGAITEAIDEDLGTMSLTSASTGGS